MCILAGVQPTLSSAITLLPFACWLTAGSCRPALQLLQAVIGNLHGQNKRWLTFCLLLQADSSVFMVVWAILFSEGGVMSTIPVDRPTISTSSYSKKTIEASSDWSMQFGFI